MNRSTDRSTDEAEIRNLIESWAKAVRAENLKDVLANHSSKILMFDLPGPTQLKGIDAYKESWPPLFTWFQGSGAFDPRELNITAGTDVAFATALIHCRGTEAIGEKVELEVRLTVGLRKIDGQWTVMHEHHSEPSR
ncbi:hypothetical protein BH20PSE1_BH20PSE1_12400 [soil metagenome]